MKANNAIKALLLIIVLSIGLLGINTLLYPKTMHMDKWREFYALQDDTIDVLFLGSSHSHRTFIPAVINETMQVDSFSLGMNGTGIAQLKYLLIEANKTQQVKIVVIEAFSLMEFDTERDKKEIFHFAFDTMKLSINKINAIKANVEKKDILEYLFPIKTYHLRWKEEDIDKEIGLVLKTKASTLNPLNFTPMTNLYSPTYNEPIINERFLTNEKKSLVSEYQKQLDDVVAICNENNIQLVITCVPYVEQKDILPYEMNEYLNGLNDYANENNIDIINYSDMSKHTNVYRSDLSDSGHVNLTGANKVSNYIATYLSEKYSEILNECIYDYHAESKKELEDLEKEIEEFELRNSRLQKRELLNSNDYSSNLAYYLELINDPNYIVLVSTKNNINTYVNNDIQDNFSKLGFDANFSKEQEENYIFISNGGPLGNIYSRTSTSKIIVSSDQQEIQDLKLPFKLDMVSSSSTTGSLSAVDFNGKMHSENEDGFNIVVYDKVLHWVVHTAGFNTNDIEQRYYDREKVKYNISQGEVIYTINIKEELSKVSGISMSIPIDGGILITSNSEEPSFTIQDIKGLSNHIAIRLVIEAPEYTKLEVLFKDKSRTFYDDYKEVTQLLFGENEILIEIHDTDITDIKFNLGDLSGDYIIKSLEIFNLNNEMD